MPRPRSPEGKNENVCVKVSETLMANIDAARGTRSRSDWGRDAFLAALDGPPRTSPADIEMITDGRMPEGFVALVTPGQPPVVMHAVPDEGTARPKNCKHLNMRMSKGVCPDCHDWVTSKR